VPKPAVPESENLEQISEQGQYAEEMRKEIPVERSAYAERWRIHELLSWCIVVP
jgi:hypothetical protein